MELDMEKIMILFQRRYSGLQEIRRITTELSEAFRRSDQVSVSILLKSRAEEMEQVDQCIQDIWREGESSPSLSAKLKELMEKDPSGDFPHATYEEKKIREIRIKTRQLLEELRTLDRSISHRTAGSKSYYNR